MGREGMTYCSDVPNPASENLIPSLECERLSQHTCSPISKRTLDFSLMIGVYFKQNSETHCDGEGGSSYYDVRKIHGTGKKSNRLRTRRGGAASERLSGDGARP